ncbi:hypothetical protein TUBRATIS_12490 [Tubulinosema ratisbonensis]|uniref:Uncharacterized protein n=1 Tax=Tubulinosema ratisbonensis TaxID=291195 RepID=A0A437AME2_9MICR|nr:hypothetical protein TUBRATIS_12490 [Tubulinosema ratisbonensis]
MNTKALLKTFLCLIAIFFGVYLCITLCLKLSDRKKRQSNKTLTPRKISSDEMGIFVLQTIKMFQKYKDFFRKIKLEIFQKIADILENFNESSMEKEDFKKDLKSLVKLLNIDREYADFCPAYLPIELTSLLSFKLDLRGFHLNKSDSNPHIKEFIDTLIPYFCDQNFILILNILAGYKLKKAEMETNFVEIFFNFDKKKFSSCKIYLSKVLFIYVNYKFFEGNFLDLNDKHFLKIQLQNKIYDYELTGALINVKGDYNPEKLYALINDNGAWELYDKNKKIKLDNEPKIPCLLRFERI